METNYPHKFVNGIGGFFFKAKDPVGMGMWYEKHFGINSMDSKAVWKQEEGYTMLSAFKEDTEYFGSRAQTFMICLRVTNLDGLLSYLEEEGVCIDDERLCISSGKFAWIYDPEGNKIELWEPIVNRK